MSRRIEAVTVSSSRRCITETQSEQNRAECVRSYNFSLFFLRILSSPKFSCRFHTAQRWNFFISERACDFWALRNLGNPFNLRCWSIGPSSARLRSSGCPGLRTGVRLSCQPALTWPSSLPDHIDYVFVTPLVALGKCSSSQHVFLVPTDSSVPQKPRLACGGRNVFSFFSRFLFILFSSWLRNLTFFDLRFGFRVKKLYILV